MQAVTGGESSKPAVRGGGGHSKECRLRIALQHRNWGPVTSCHALHISHCLRKGSEESWI